MRKIRLTQEFMDGNHIGSDEHNVDDDRAKELVDSGNAIYIDGVEEKEVEEKETKEMKPKRSRKGYKTKKVKTTRKRKKKK